MDCLMLQISVFMASVSTRFSQEKIHMSYSSIAPKPPLERCSLKLTCATRSLPLRCQLQLCSWNQGTSQTTAPPNWQHHIVSAHERHHRGSGVLESSITDSLPESQRRSSKGRICKNFLTDGWCPYGDNCTFLHDNYYSTTQESVTISVTPTFCAAASNWKTRLCNKWEKTGSCSFGTNCYFTHGVGELHKYGGAGKIHR